MSIWWLEMIALINVLAKGKPSKIILKHFQITFIKKLSIVELKELTGVS